MGVFYQETWKCNSCHYKINLMRGCYEADPSDFGTTHFVSPYYCPKCNSVKNVINHAGLEEPKPENKNRIHNDSNICEQCDTEMKVLEKGKLFKKWGIFKEWEKHNCPECGKKQFHFVSEIMCIT